MSKNKQPGFEHEPVAFGDSPKGVESTPANPLEGGAVPAAGPGYLPGGGIGDGGMVGRVSIPTSPDFIKGKG